MKATKDFKSALGQLMARYVELKEALGLSFFHQSRVLHSMDRFLSGIDGGAGDLSQVTFAGWCSTLAHLASGSRRRYMEVVRNFCVYRRRTEPKCFVPDAMLFPSNHQRVRPYIITEKEILDLLAVTSTLPRDFSLRPEIFRLAIVLLYTTGLRRGELLQLTIGDYDTEDQTLFIRETKFHKSRYVPLSLDAVAEIERFLYACRAHRVSLSSNLPFMWNGRAQRRSYTGEGFSLVVRALLKSSGIRKPNGRLPRVQDFRHSFAVHSLLRWYRSGVDVQAKLPLLATYMGHVSIASTQYYLPFIELLSEAASVRFERRFGKLVTAGPEPKGE